MFGRKKETPESMANGIARNIARRGFPAKAKQVTATSVMGNVRKHAIAIPGRGVAVINSDLSIVVASSNKPLPQAPVFEYENAEAAAENILRYLPLS
jgi:hypothetical protein|nr:MAG TPA: hypothetical protein [Caudoviricetes sp.]